MSKKLTVYLGDLVHNSVVKGPFTMPLNIGCIASYAKKKFNQEIDIKLFKYPLHLLDAVREKPPHILALANYVWNENLNYNIIKYAKARTNKLIAVCGGPNLPIKRDEQEVYLRKKSLIDFYVVNQGEIGFSNIVKKILETCFERKPMMNSSIGGCIFINPENGGLVSGKQEKIPIALDEFPSPYLTGEMDAFFDGNLIPIIETDRGCPFSCTFCAWGKAVNNRVRQFSITRIKEELEYISGRVKNTNLLFIADSNFGIREQSKEIAEHIRRLKLETGYPRSIHLCWTKNSSQRIVEIAEILGNMVEITMSLQSLDKNVLKNIKRSNIRISTFIDLQMHFSQKKIPTKSEVILGLPGETRQSHLDTLKQIVDFGADNIICYNCRMLKGAVLNTHEQKKRYKIGTKYRLFDVGFGKYREIISIEADEVVRSTNTMSSADIEFFRPIHWLIQFMWSFKYYIHLLKFLQTLDINPVDLMALMILDKNGANPAVAKLFNDFDHEASDEWFDTREELVQYYSKEKNFKIITGGDFAKLNYKYSFKVLLEMRNEFDHYLIDSAKKILGHNIFKSTKEIINNLIRFSQSTCVDFDNDLNFRRKKQAVFNYDIIAWEQEDYSKPLSNYREKEPVSYLFYIDNSQHNALTSNIKQFWHGNPNKTLCKMSEYMRKKDLFYKVKRK